MKTEILKLLVRMVNGQCTINNNILLEVIVWPYIYNMHFEKWKDLFSNFPGVFFKPILIP